PASVNEGTADALGLSEDGDSQLAEYAAGSMGMPFLRDLASFKTCRGRGETKDFAGWQVNGGFDGEMHDDGEIWGGFFWELKQNLGGVDTSAVCNGSHCDAAAMI